MLLIALWSFFSCLCYPTSVGLVDAFAVARPFVTTRTYTNQLHSAVSKEEGGPTLTTTTSRTVSPRPRLPKEQQHRLGSPMDWWKPPAWLEVLQVGECWRPFPDDHPDCQVTKICHDPCLLHVQNLGRPRTPEWVQSLCLEPASTRSEPSQSLHRSGAAVAWIRRTDDEVEDETSHTTAAVADYLTQLTQALFVNSDNDNNDDAWEAEPLQVVHYNASGYYHLHHDGFQRAVTVLHYWNGVAGTWFPWAGTDCGTAGPDQEAWDWQNPSQLVQDLEPGRDGVVFVGREADACESETYSFPPPHPTNSTSITTTSSTVVRIQPGDAVVFYNYCQYESDDDDNEDPHVGMNWKSMHAAQPAHHHEKWIATNWFRFREDSRQ